MEEGEKGNEEVDWLDDLNKRGGREKPVYGPAYVRGEGRMEGREEGGEKERREGGGGGVLINNHIGLTVLWSKL